MGLSLCFATLVSGTQKAHSCPLSCYKAISSDRNPNNKEGKNYHGWWDYNVELVVLGLINGQVLVGEGLLMLLRGRWRWRNLLSLFYPTPCLRTSRFLTLVRFPFFAF